MKPALKILLCVSLGAGLVCAASGVGFTRDPANVQKAAPQLAGKLTSLNKQRSVLLDRHGKRVLLKSKVVLREGLLEMLCCLSQTKEHESVLAVDARAFVIHAALLAVGAKPGHPVQFSPKFEPPSGQTIDIFLQWADEKGKLHRVKAQQWIRHATHRFYAAQLKKRPPGLTIPKMSELFYDERNKELSWFGHMTKDQRDQLLELSKDAQYRKAIRGFFQQSQPKKMKHEWVFAGSDTFVDEETGEKFYEAEQGDVICLANFPSAMIDVGAQSSASGKSNLLFEADTDKIPPVGTKVTIELVPAISKKSAADKTKK